MQPIITLLLGAAMTLIGITGIVRQESGALSAAERKTLLGRAITLILGLIWLITGLMFVVVSTSPIPARQTFIGFTALAATLSFLIVFVASLLLASLIRKPQRSYSAETGGVRIVLPVPTQPRFRRMQPVTHPEYGKGVVLSTYKQESIEMVSVRFRYEVFAVPAASLNDYPAAHE